MIKNILILGLSFVLFTEFTVSCNSKEKREETEAMKSTSHKPVDKKFVILAEQTNAQLPMVVGTGITLEKTEAVSDKEFKYYYKLDKKPHQSVDKFVENSKFLIIEALKKVRNAPDIKLFSEDKITLIYAYSTNEGTFAEVRIAPEEYTK